MKLVHNDVIMKSKHHDANAYCLFARIIKYALIIINWLKTNITKSLSYKR